MSRQLPALFLLYTLSLYIEAQDARPADPWPGPKKEYVFIEAEDFNLGEGWAVQNLEYGFRSEHRESGQKIIWGRSKGNGDCTKDVSVPAEGEYKLWVSFCANLSDDDDKRGPFRVVVTQGGAEKASKVFDEEFDGAKRKDAESRRLIRRQAREDRNPPYRWESVSINLKAGPATIIVRKEGKQTADLRCRKIDCLLLTRDLEYTPDFRDFGPQTYMRAQLVSSTPENVYLLAGVHHMHTPLRHHFTVGRSGVKESYTQPATEFFGPGDSTGWINLSRYLYNDCDSNIELRAVTAYREGGEAQSAHLKLDFATAPNDGAIVRSFDRDGKGAGIIVRLPPDLVHGRKPKSDLEYAQDNRKMIEELPRPAFGRVPQKFPVLTTFDIDEADVSPGVRDCEIKALTELGLNGIRGESQPQDKDAGIRFSVARANVSSLGKNAYLDVAEDGWKADVEKRAAVLKADPQSYIAAMVTDEASPEPLDLLKKNPATQQAFIKWLQKQNKKPADFNVADWSKVEFTTDRDTKTPALYLESQRFRAASIALAFRVVTESVRQCFPATARTMQNFSDGAVYCGNMYAQGNDYFTWFRDVNALDLAYTEDWTNGGSTGQLCGWNAALFRAATRVHKQPLGMLVVSYHKRLPRDIKLKSYSSIAQGAKSLQFYCYTLPYHQHEQGEYFSPPVASAVMEVTREIGAAEDVLLDAEPVPAKSVIIYSRVADIWNVGYDSIDGHERMHTYLAFRHAQKAVEVVDEDQVIGNALQGKDTVYLFGEQLDQRAVPPIVEFVKNGGTLVLSPGAGQRDELNRHSDLLDKGLGIRRETVKREQLFWGPSRDLGSLKPFGEVTLGFKPWEVTVPYYAVRQNLGAEGNDMICARFKDGMPASVIHNSGGGRVVMNGFLPAISYIATALAKGHTKAQPALDDATEDAVEAEKRTTLTSFPLASDFNSDLRTFVCRGAASKEQIEVDAPLVEATLMEGKNGWVVPLANYTGAALKEITVTVRAGDREFNEVRSSRLGVLKPEPIPGEKSIRIKIPLDSTDMIFAEWKR